MAATTGIPRHSAPLGPGRAHGQDQDHGHGRDRWSTQEPSAPVRALRTRPWLGPLGAGGLVGLATAYTAWQDPNAGGAFPQCPTRTLFGIDCPGCGGLRAVHALTQGDIAAAADHNLVLMVILPVLVALWGIWLLRTLGVRTPPVPHISGRGWWAVGLTTLAFAVVRNIGGVGVFEYLNSTT